MLCNLFYNTEHNSIIQTHLKFSFILRLSWIFVLCRNVGLSLLDSSAKSFTDSPSGIRKTSQGGKALS